MKAVNSAIVIGGLGSTAESMRPLCLALEPYFPDDIYPVSLREAARDRELARKLKGRPVITHSAGATVVDRTVRSSGVLPHEVFNIAPPTGDISAFGLVFASIPKSYHLLCRNRQDGDTSTVWSYQKTTAKEIALHPKVTIDAIRSVANHDVVETATWMALQGVASRLIWHHFDDYFRPGSEAVSAIETRVPNIRVHLLAGEHDEALVRPMNVVPYVFDASVAN